MSKAKPTGAKKKSKKKRRVGKLRGVPASVGKSITRAISQVRMAKKGMEKKAPSSRKAWAELHNVESRLTRLV